MWCHVKHHRMANHTIDDVGQLHATAAEHLEEIGRSQPLMRACFHGAELALSLTNAQ